MSREKVKGKKITSQRKTVDKKTHKKRKNSQTY